jgi:hypothetical protein
MITVLWVLLGVALTLSGLAFAVYRGIRPVAAAAAYRNLAWKLGLEADTRGRTLQGFLDGRRLFIGLADDAAAGATTLRATLDLERPLGLGLRVRPRGLSERVRRARPGLTTGDPELDGPLDLRAYDPARVQALFTDEVREALSRLRAGWPALEVHDHGIRVDLPSPITREDALRRLIEHLRRLAVALESARRAVPPPPQVEDWLPAWRALAEDHGLQLEPALPMLTGAWDGVHVEVRCARLAEDRFAAEVRAYLADHRPTGLWVIPAARAATTTTAGQDIHTDDASFDADFVIKGYDPFTIRRVLDDGVRHAIRALAVHGAIAITDRAVDLRGAAIDRASLEPAIQAAHAVAEELRRAWAAVRHEAG